MKLDELFRATSFYFPMATVMEDMDGEIVIHTGLMYDAPLGYDGMGPQNIPPNRRGEIELREMTHEDIA